MALSLHFIFAQDIGHFLYSSVTSYFLLTKILKPHSCPSRQQSHEKTFRCTIKAHCWRSPIFSAILSHRLFSSVHSNSLAICFTASSSARTNLITSLSDKI